MLVTGTPRSGTTFVGRMLALPPDVGYLDEPFNVQMGIHGIEQQFLHLTAAHPEATRYRGLLEDLLAGRATFRRGAFDGPATSVVARAGRRVFGSRANFRYHLMAVDPRVRRWLLKDPIACLASEYLHRELGMQVVVVVRHPAAVVASFLRLGWRFPIDEMLAQPGMPAELGSAAKLLPAPPRDAVVEGAYLWRFQQQVLETYAERNPSMLVVRHEDLSRDPLPRFRELYTALGLTWTDDVARTITEHTSRDNPVEAPGGVAHALARDSADLVQAWRKRMTDEQAAQVRDIVEPVSGRRYGDADW
ncbi:MAG: sulfotransferase [Frankiaceae bacterium]|nr:sulfotransferase [Frankiaceae bacterium]